MIVWAPIFHFYQPPTQSPAILRKICRESYRPLIAMLGEFDGARATVNVTGALTEMLADCGHQDVIDGLRKLAEQGRVEFVDSAAYHPILPLIPDEEIRRQIALNRATNRRAFGDVYQPTGFFPPELAYGPSVAKAVAGCGYRWIVVAGVACPAAWPVTVVHCIADQPSVSVLFRDDIVSNRISFCTTDGFGFIDYLRSLAQSSPSVYVVTAMDAETFGHHVRDWERLFLAHVYAQLECEPPAMALADGRQSANTAGRPVFRSPAQEPDRDVVVLTATQLLERFPPGLPVTPKPSSWSTSAADLADKVPYPLWDHPQNEIHRLLWRHLQICIQIVDEAWRVVGEEPEARRHADLARGLLDRALHSCQFWWASRRPMWDINMIQRGLEEQSAVTLNAARAIRLSKPNDALHCKVDDLVILAQDVSRRLFERLATPPMCNES